MHTYISIFYKLLPFKVRVVSQVEVAFNDLLNALSA